MSTVTIFGADGRTGVCVIQEAQAQGYHVRAFVYNEDARQYMPEGVEVVVGDILNFEAVHKAITGTDVVISVVGHIQGSDPFMQTKGMQNIISAMKREGVNRILSLTGTGVRTEGDRPSLIDRFANVAVRLFDRDRIIDGIQHVQVLRESGLHWTVVRVLKLSNKDLRDTETEYVLSEHGPAEYVTARSKVARVLVDLIDRSAYVHKMPIIAG